MTSPTLHTLRDVREKLARYRFDAAVRFSGVQRERLAALEESTAEPSVFEAYALGRIYGVDPDLLTEWPLQLQADDAVTALALQEEFTDLADEVRFRVVRAANAARDLQRLRKLVGESTDNAPARLVGERGLPPFQQGRKHAEQIRKQEKLGTSPIVSMRDFVQQHFPSISVLYANLSSEGPAGVTFADRVRGPTIVINLDGKNANPSVRRFSLAHELYHVLADWSRKQPLALLSGYLSEDALAVEQRANGFAARLICPESVVRKISKKDAGPTRIRSVIGPYGLHYQALRLYLKNVASVSLSVSPPSELVGVGLEAEWLQAEEPTGIAGFPLPDVAPERRTLVAQRAANLYASGKIGRKAFASFLEVSPIHELETVLDFFGLDRPDEAE